MIYGFELVCSLFLLDTRSLFLPRFWQTDVPKYWIKLSQLKNLSVVCECMWVQCECACVCARAFVYTHVCVYLTRVCVCNKRQEKGKKKERRERLRLIFSVFLPLDSEDFIFCFQRIKFNKSFGQKPGKLLQLTPF